MSDFQRLQAAIMNSTAEREHDRAQCEGFLNALYHAVRTAEGHGQPLNNVSLELVPEGRVRREGGVFVGEYGEGGSFRIVLSEGALRDLARRLMAEGLRLYGVQDVESAPN